MATFSRNIVRLSVLTFKNVSIITSNCNKRYIMMSRARLEKAVENLEKNPFFNKYADKIARFQQTSPEEFLQRVESQEKKLQQKKVRLSRSFPFLLRKRPPPWTHIQKSNFSDHAVKNMYITTPIFYVNAGPHIGHVYTAVLADAIARFNTMLGHSVFLCTGTDEHGTKVQKAANTAALPIPEYCTRVSRQFQDVCDNFQVQYSRFIRTTETRHREAVHHFWNRLENNGHIYRGKYAGWYNVSEEAFVSDKEVLHKSSATNAFTESGDVLEWTEEDGYKFRLTSFVDDLKYWLKDENVIQPAMYRNSLVFWLDDLRDLSISRPVERVPWAIRTPSDESHTIYVWLDALVNYLTALGYPDKSFTEFWPPVQVIGKDILKFHGIYWPAFLIAAGLEPPKKLVCHGHWVIQDKKMSKSKGNVISPSTAVRDFTEEGLRYFLLRQATLQADANYNKSKVRKVLNSELADTLGNLINRCFGPAINPNKVLHNSAEYADILESDVARRNISSLEDLGEKAKKHYEEYNLHHAIEAVMDTLHITNQMFEYHQPWCLIKCKDPDSLKELEAVISLALENLRVAALVLHPIIPKLTSELLEFLQVPMERRTWNDTKPLHLTSASHSTRRHVPSENIMFFRKIKN
ncbi:methionine--tRNA ligase, mitochondrial-like [Ceratina calcarata]|uniref:Methionine--tRNA ligase, mitochondrial n=1 Tax=Ceratina calcarata TaxID=156304 RepID=A0AAJ7JH72_9HYME|nr:methionine--tRNA ligase, mitochondrial-like [Ceratina calcarata]